MLYKHCLPHYHNNLLCKLLINYSYILQLGKKNSLLYAINGLLFAAVFIIFRVMVYPYLYWRYAQYSNLGFMEVPFSIPFCCNFACFLLMSLQLNWSYIILKECIKYIHREPTKETLSNGKAVSHSTENGQANHFIKELPEDNHFKQH